MEYKHSVKQIYLINYHLIWCPKRRKPILIGKVSEGVADFSLRLKMDHLHLFISAYPTIAVHKLVKAFKERNSNILRKEFPRLLRLPSLWTHSYSVSTAGNVSNQTIQRYIQAQSKT